MEGNDCGRHPGFDFKLDVHVNYQQTVLPMADGLPKQQDFPQALGGTGTVIAE